MSTITNTSIKTLGDYTIDELASVSLDQIGAVAINQQFTPVTNTTKINIAETWDHNTSTWDTETRTWDDMASLIDNTSFKNLGSYTVDELADISLEQVANVEFSRQFSPITNTSKPS